MTTADFASSLLALLDAKPFRRFTVTLTSGETFEVDRGNAVATRKGIAVFIAAGGRPHLFDTANTVAFTPTAEG